MSRVGMLLFLEIRDHSGNCIPGCLSEEHTSSGYGVACLLHGREVVSSAVRVPFAGNQSFLYHLEEDIQPSPGDSRSSLWAQRSYSVTCSSGPRADQCFLLSSPVRAASQPVQRSISRYLALSPKGTGPDVVA